MKSVICSSPAAPDAAPGTLRAQIENVLPEAHPACNVAFRRKELAAAGGFMAA